MFRTRNHRHHAFVAILALGASAAPAFGQNLCGTSEFVERGDTLFGIADRCGTTVEALQDANPELDPAEMRVGMRIAMPSTTAAAAIGGSDERPRGGDRMAAMARLANMIGVPVQELIARDDALVAAEAPVGASAEYRPDTDGESARVTGRITDEGVECPTLRGPDGTLYSLAGDTALFEAGDAVTVTGSFADMSMCMQGRTLSVESITAAQ